MRFSDLAPQMLRVLSKAQELRPQKLDWIGDELEWIIYEREVMLSAINAVRLQCNQPAVTVEQVKRIENCAKGHSDYSHKYALYAAELALREPA